MAGLGKPWVVPQWALIGLSIRSCFSGGRIAGVYNHASAIDSGHNMRIAIGGFQHETNPFAPSKATFDDFVRGGGWPPLLTGEQVFEGVKGMNLPLAGFIAHMSGTPHQLLPSAWASATPSAHVTEDAYERFAKLLLDGIRKAEPDAVYLDLHGAMVA